MTTKKAVKVKSAKGKPAPKKNDVKKKKTTPSIEFKLYAPDARRVFLVGEFNDWDPTAVQMRRFKDGTCKKAMPLKPGRYEYRFLVDGQWWTDPDNGQRVANPYGEENSVVVVG